MLFIALKLVIKHRYYIYIKLIIMLRRQFFDFVDIFMYYAYKTMAVLMSLLRVYSMFPLNCFKKQVARLNIIHVSLCPSAYSTVPRAGAQWNDVDNFCST